MITDIDPYSATRSAFSSQIRTTSSRHRAFQGRVGEFSQRRAYRESSFERTHGSLWEPGLLDRLTSPLTRYHE
jgi:hypothetical protein